MRLLLLLSLLICVISASIVLKSPGNLQGTTQVQLGVPPRFMWGWGAGLRGYCGSFSFQSFGLLYGNWISAEHIRNSADRVELLIAVNDETAAKALKFEYEEWDWENTKAPQATAFFAWVANHIDNGHGVVTGMFEQTNNGDPDYDHIMPIVGYLRDDSVQISADINLNASRPDVAGIYYNDLYRNSQLYGTQDSTFIRTRNKCGAPGGVQPKAAPYQFCLPSQYNYGIALMGNRDDNGETYPSRLTVPSWTEPDWGAEDNKHEAAVQFTVSLVVSGLTSGSKYTVLRFDTPAAVPTKGFSSGSFTARFDFTATGATHTMTNFDSFSSDRSIFYRTVKFF